MQPTDQADEKIPFPGDNESFNNFLQHSVDFDEKLSALERRESLPNFEDTFVKPGLMDSAESNSGAVSPPNGRITPKPTGQRQDVTRETLPIFYEHFIRSYHATSGHKHCKVPEHLSKFLQPPKYQKKTFSPWDLYLIVKSVNGLAQSWCDVARRLGFDTKGTNIAARVKDWVLHHHIHCFCDYLLGIPNSFYIDREDLPPSTEDPIPARKRGRPPKGANKRPKLDDNVTETDLELDALADGSPSVRKADFTSDEEEDSTASIQDVIVRAESILQAGNESTSVEDYVDCISRQLESLKALKARNALLRNELIKFGRLKQKIIGLLNS